MRRPPFASTRARVLAVARVAAVWTSGGMLAATPVWLANALTQPTAIAAAAHGVQIVTCTNVYCFDPSTVSGDPGDGVMWTNTTGASHTVTRCDASACAGQGPGTGGDTLNSPTLMPNGGSYSHTFNSSGTYFYYCSIHGYARMHGEVVVSATSTPAPTARPTPRPTPRPVVTSASTVMTPAKTATPAPSATATAIAPSPLAVVLPTVSATPSPAATASPSVAGTTAPTGSDAPVVPILAVLLVVAALGGAGYMTWRRRSAAP